MEKAERETAHKRRIQKKTHNRGAIKVHIIGGQLLPCTSFSNILRFIFGSPVVTCDIPPPQKKTVAKFLKSGHGYFRAETPRGEGFPFLGRGICRKQKGRRGTDFEFWGNSPMVEREKNYC